MEALGTVLNLVANGQAQKLAQNGSPMLLSTAGKLLGLGDGELDAAKGGRLPWWVWVAGGLALGFAAGAYVQREHPGKVPGFLGGGG